jgi:hypothetical protein
MTEKLCKDCKYFDDYQMSKTLGPSCSLPKESIKYDLVYGKSVKKEMRWCREERATYASITEDRCGMQAKYYKERVDNNTST